MPIYKIADLNILINPMSSHMQKRLEPYIQDCDCPDFEIKLSREDVLRCLARTKELGNECAAEGTMILNEICTRVLEQYDGFFFHSSALMLNGEAYLFTAKSGTGKSTHTGLWRTLFKDKVVMINDDKPIVRKIGGVFYACGTPWMGKSNIGSNIKAPVRAVYVLQRGENNSVVRVKPGDVFKQLLEATVVPKNRENMVKLLSLYDELFTCADLFLLKCNTDISAARIAYEAVIKDTHKDKR